jgi:hydroxymethylpyrimidine/phosphomethylpyrimidine kinase
MKRALTIAGSDPSGGAGIQQDLKVFQASGVWGLSAVTALTSQDTIAIDGLLDISPDFLSMQIAACARDIGVDAAKVGMIPTRALVEAVADAIVRHGITAFVVDPVLVATSGDALTIDDTSEALHDLLIPRALVVTPNAAEAEQLAGVSIRDRATQIEAARALRKLGARNAIVTGGDVDAADVLVTEAGEVIILEGERFDVGQVHGTGCTFSAALTAGLAKGWPVERAFRSAKGFTARAIENAIMLGKGARMLDVRGIEEGGVEG